MVLPWKSDPKQISPKKGGENHPLLVRVGIQMLRKQTILNVFIFTNHETAKDAFFRVRS